MKIATISYVPPKGRLNSESYMHNLESYKLTHPLYLYSDDPSWGFNQIENPEVIRHPKKHFAVNNLVFLFGLNLAMDLGLDYMIYLESDCRMRGDKWDEIITNDCFRENKQPILYGTPVIFNISQSGFTPLRMGLELAHNYLRTTNCPPVVHGAWPGSPAHFLVFPNGALGVYHVPTLNEIFNGFKADIGRSALDMAAWDHSVGVGFFTKFGVSCCEKFQFSTCSFSGYGDQMTTPEWRKDLLMSGKMVGIHQWKGSESLV